MIKKSLGILLALILTGCMDEIKERPAPLGKESTVADAQKAFEKTYEGISILNSQVGQYVEYEDNWRIEVGSVFISNIVAHTLLDIKFDPTHNPYFVLFEDRWDFNVKGEIIDEKHSEMDPIQFIDSLKATSDREKCDGKDIVDDFGVKYDCIKYFNLVSEVRRVPPPQKVAAKPNCMNIPNCLMTVRYLKYDQVKWRKGASVETVTVKAEVAPEVPDLLFEKHPDGWTYLPASLNFCFSGVFVYEGSKYYGTRCRVLRDFQ